MSLPESVLRTIDTEIKPLIILINELPFVRTTLYSCAGYGEAGLGYRAPFGIPADDPRGHKPTADGNYDGYVILEYKGHADTWQDYHFALTKLVDRMEKDRRNRVQEYVYHIWGTPEYLAEKWAKIYNLTKRYLRF